MFQALTCAQPANTYQEDANMLMSWYSGWYNGLAQALHGRSEGKSRRGQVIGYCKANPNALVIDAISVQPSAMISGVGLDHISSRRTM
jgi:hypothetical protein